MKNSAEKADGAATKLSIVIALVTCVATWFSYDIVM